MEGTELMSLIDPREFGRLEAEVKHLQAQVAGLHAQVNDTNEKLDTLVKLASEGKGGIRTLWFIGTCIAGVLGWLGADKILK